MKQRQKPPGNRVRLAVALFAILMACTDSSTVGGDDDTTTPTGGTLSGSFALLELDNQQLPADLGAIPSKDGQQSSCRMIVAEGSLLLSGPDFRIHYDVRESCSGSIINGGAGAEGSFEQTGSALSLRADLGGGASETYQGVIESTRIRVTTPLHNYVFRR